MLFFCFVFDLVVCGCCVFGVMFFFCIFLYLIGVYFDFLFYGGFFGSKAFDFIYEGEVSGPFGLIVTGKQIGRAHV